MNKTDYNDLINELSIKHFELKKEKEKLILESKKLLEKTKNAPKFNLINVKELKVINLESLTRIALSEKMIEYQKRTNEILILE